MGGGGTTSDQKLFDLKQNTCSKGPAYPFECASIRNRYHRLQDIQPNVHAYVRPEEDIMLLKMVKIAKMPSYGQQGMYKQET
jgi:hypothetical protein